MLTVGKCLEHELHSDFVVRNREVFHYLLFTCSRVLKTTHLQSDFFYDTLRKDIIDVIVFHIKELILNR